MRLDVIICTYNRPGRLSGLIRQLQSCKPIPDQIIIVDSSDEMNDQWSNTPGIKYLQSNHKNQPYQRFIGAKHSTADFLLYLDDDMEVIKKDFIQDIQDILSLDESKVGIALCFKDKFAETAMSDLPSSILTSKKSLLRNWMNWFTGIPKLREGQFGLCGNRGRQPIKGGNTEWLSGGAFVAKREKLFNQFNFQLFDLFEQKLGMGEDAILGYGLSKQGNLYFYPPLLFYHDDQRESHYSLAHRAFFRRIIFSRLFLSLDKTRLDGHNKLHTILHYHWYVCWRIMGMFINYILRPSNTRKEILKGAISGWKLSFSFNFDYHNSRKTYWLEESEKVKLST